MPDHFSWTTNSSIDFIKEFSLASDYGTMYKKKGNTPIPEKEYMKKKLPSLKDTYPYGCLIQSIHSGNLGINFTTTGVLPTTHSNGIVAWFIHPAKELEKAVINIAYKITQSASALEQFTKLHDLVKQKGDDTEEQLKLSFGTKYVYARHVKWFSTEGFVFQVDDMSGYKVVETDFFQKLVDPIIVQEMELWV